MHIEMRKVKRKGFPCHALFVDGKDVKWHLPDSSLMEFCGLANSRVSDEVFDIFAASLYVSKKIKKKMTVKDIRNLQAAVQKAIDETFKDPCAHKDGDESTWKSVNHDIHQCSKCGAVARI
jgi:hypothetical protein